MEWETIKSLLIILAVLFFIFVALREFWTWFWKINSILNRQHEMIAEQKETNRILRLLAKAEAAKHKENNK